VILLSLKQWSKQQVVKMLCCEYLQTSTLSFAPTLQKSIQQGNTIRQRKRSCRMKLSQEQQEEAADAVLKAQAAGTQTAASIAGNRVNAQRGTSNFSDKESESWK